MQLSNSDYERIMRDYDSKQYKSNLIFRERRQKLYEIIPELKALDDEISTASARLAKQSLFLSEEEFAELTKLLSKKNQDIREKKESLMKVHGFPSDYLTNIYECPSCKDTGFVEGDKCHCFQKTADALFKRKEMLNKLAENAKFSNFNLSYYKENDFHLETGKSSRETALLVLNQAKDYVKHFKERRENLLIYGNTGTGKTFLASCIANALMEEGYSVSFVTAFQLYHLFEKYTFRREEAEVFRLAESSVSSMVESDLLVIDDIGTEAVNSFTRTKLYEIINERLSNKRSTIITTNFDLNTIKKTYEERILSRLIGHYHLMKMTGEDIRFLLNSHQ